MTSKLKLADRQVFAALLLAAVAAAAGLRPRDLLMVHRIAIGCGRNR
jgi:hypothetical protein